MKRFFAFLLSLFLIYMAGMYRYPALMALGVGQVLLLLFLTAQNRICGRRIRAAFANESLRAVKGQPISCGLTVEYRGKLPPGSVRFLIRYGYGEKKKKQRLYGNGNGKETFRICPVYCGMARLHLEALWVYDYLSFGIVKKKMSAGMQVMVFPREQALDIRFPEDGCGRELETDRTEAAALSENGETFQVREYRKGDSARHLHWKLSARAGQPLVKEQEREKRQRAALFLDLQGYQECGQQDRDGFYEVLSALVLGLLRERQEILVSWQDGELKPAAMLIAEAPQCRELLARLYRMDASGGSLPVESDTDFVLDLQLRLLQGGRVLYQFPAEGLAAEIQKARILIGG